MSAGGALDPNPFIKLVWGGVMAALVAILLVAGGLDAPQYGDPRRYPFGILMLFLCWSLQRTLSADYREQMSAPDTEKVRRGRG